MLNLYRSFDYLYKKLFMGLDIFFLILIVWAAYIGFTKGFILQVASLAALILGIYGAIKTSGYLSNYLSQKTNTYGEYLPIISFAITFIIIVIIIHFLARMLEKIVEIIALGLINRIFGAVLSIIKYSLIISVILVILNNFDRKASFLPKKQIQKSFFYTRLFVLAPFIYPYFRYNFFPNEEIPYNPVDEFPV
jgi:membrane protein required for colicin V production